MKVGVLALQGDVREHCGLLDELGAHSVEVRSEPDLSGVDALVIPGGESTTLSLLIGSSGLRDPLASMLREGMPAMGTCAGLILLSSEILDGRPDQWSFGTVGIAVRRNAFGPQRESFECDLDVEGIGRVPAVFIRAPVVERAGPEVEVLSSVAGRPVVCRQGPVLVTCFHPELSGDLRLHQLFLNTVDERGL